MDVSIRHVGVATVIVTVGDTTFINDPCFNEGGDWYHHGFGAFSRKTGDPRYEPDELPEDPDLGLVTHGHHSDNLDDRGRTMLQSVSEVFCTCHSAGSLEGGVGMNPGDSRAVEAGGQSLTVHAVPAQHGIFLLSVLTGPVNGYVLEFEEEDFRIYVTGDTIFTEDIASRVESIGPVDLFIPHLGNAYFPYLSGPIRYTLNAEGFQSFVEVLEPSCTYPIHNEGWSHFRPVDVESIAGLERHTRLRRDPETRLTL